MFFLPVAWTKRIGDCRANERVVPTDEYAIQSVNWYKTITFDNGKEFAYHHKIVSALGIETYFAKPYHSWKRGTNENTNGLLRQYFPKGTDFGMVSEAEVLVIQRKLNTRPRKCLGFKTPLEVLHAVA